MQSVALVLGLFVGWLAAFLWVSPIAVGVAGFVGLDVPAGLNPAILWLCIAFCSYFVAAPASWRGLWRRTFVVFGVSLLAYAALGYVFVFAGVPAEGGMPDLPTAFQLTVLVVGLAGVGAFYLLRQDGRPAELAVGPAGSGSSDSPAGPIDPVGPVGSVGESGDVH